MKKLKQEYVVYILLCKDTSLYTGITTDVVRRFEEHKSRKGGNYTRSHVPEKIVYTEKVVSRSAALMREAEIKKLSRSQKIGLFKLNK